MCAVITCYTIGIFASVAGSWFKINAYKKKVDVGALFISGSERLLCSMFKCWLGQWPTVQLKSFGIHVQKLYSARTNLELSSNSPTSCFELFLLTFRYAFQKQIIPGRVEPRLSGDSPITRTTVAVKCSSCVPYLHVACRPRDVYVIGSWGEIFKFDRT